jgi:predicted class III extradiol MEMO1 family dioxygenase
MSSNVRRKRKIGNLATTVTVEVPVLTIVASEDLQVLPEVVEVVTSAAAEVAKVAREAETTSEEMVMVVATDLIAQVGIAEDRDTDQL